MFYGLFLLETEEQRDRFVEIYDRNKDRMYHIAFRFLGQKEETENAVHDAFMKLADHFGRYERLSEREMDALCITVVKNTAADLIDKQKKEILFEPEEIERQSREWGGSINILEDAAMEKEQADQIRRLLKELSGIYHDILVLRYYCDLSVKEIAEILGISKKTAEVRIYRAKERLRKVLYENGIQHVGNAG